MTVRRVGVTAPLGFMAAGVHCGIKKSSILDLALIVSSEPGPIAGVFTMNRLPAAPVQLDRLHLRGGVGQAVIINSGNANACTGPQGIADAEEMTTLVARRLDVKPQTVFVGSTGVIGQPLPMARVREGIPSLMARARRTGEHVLRVYGWSSPTLSLGRNQHANGIYLVDELEVRRTLEREVRRLCSLDDLVGVIRGATAVRREARAE